MERGYEKDLINILDIYLINKIGVMEEESYKLLEGEGDGESYRANNGSNNNQQIIPLSICESILSCFCFCCYETYKLTQDELSLYRTLQCTFSHSFLSSTHNPSDTLYNSVKHLADKVFVNDNDYTDLINRQNETEKRTKLLNYMGFFFEQCHNDVLGVGTVMNDILNYATSKVKFINAVRSMVNKRKYPFGQIFGKLVLAVKMYMYLDTDSERLKYKQQGMNITMSRKEMKSFVKYLKNSRKKEEHIVYDIICDMFIHLEKEISNMDNNETIDNLIRNEIRAFPNMLNNNKYLKIN